MKFLYIYLVLKYLLRVLQNRLSSLPKDLEHFSPFQPTRKKKTPFQYQLFERKYLKSIVLFILFKNRALYSITFQSFVTLWPFMAFVIRTLVRSNKRKETGWILLCYLQIKLKVIKISLLSIVTLLTRSENLIRYSFRSICLNPHTC